MKFRDIKMFTRDGDYEIDVDLFNLEQHIKDWEDVYKLQLNPDFQRGHVWSKEQQISFVEFFISGGKTGRKIYFNCPNWIVGSADVDKNPMQCVDGLQRITALRAFVNDELRVFGHYFSEYEDSPRRSQSIIQFNVNSLETKAEVLTWYLQMNKGGVCHTQEEIDRIESMLQDIIE